MERTGLNGGGECRSGMGSNRGNAGQERGWEHGRIGGIWGKNGGRTGVERRERGPETRLDKRNGVGLGERESGMGSDGGADEEMGQSQLGFF